jgi:hypothetical protein
MIEMTLDWQNTLALAAVLGAAMYLVRAGWNVARRGRASGCGSCSSCAATAPRLVTLGPPADLSRSGK